MKELLIAFVGKTDPIKNDYDGPILHILRHRDVNKVYLMGTSSLLEEREKFVKEGIDYISTLKSTNIEVEFLVLEKIKNPAIFIDFGLKRIIDKIYAENQDYQIIFNISSGTPQMIAALALDIVVNNRIGKAFQVLNPEPNEFTRPEKPGYDFDNLFDNLEEAKLRLKETDMYSFKISKIKTQLDATLKVRDYKKMLEILDEYNLNYKECRELIEYAYNADKLSSFHQANLNKILKQYPNLLRFKKYRNPKFRRLNIIFDYFLAWGNEMHRQNYVSAMLRLKPLFYEIMKYIILDYMQQDNSAKNSDFYKSFVRTNHIRKSDINNFDQELRKKIDINNKRVLFDTRHLIIIIKYFGITDILKEVGLIRKEEENVRNKLAHDIDNQITNQDIRDSAEISCKNIKLLINRIFKGLESSINYSFFNDIDELISNAIKNIYKEDEEV